MRVYHRKSELAKIDEEYDYGKERNNQGTDSTEGTRITPKQAGKTSACVATVG